MKNSHPLRILVISPFFAPHIGGSQRYMEELYSHLAHNYKQVKVDVLAYNTDDAPPREVYRGLTLYRITGWQLLPGQFALPNPVSLIPLLVKLAKNHYDVVHAHIRFFDAAWWAWIYAKIIKARCIFTEHVASHPVHPQASVQLVAKIVDLTMAAWALPHYDLITTTNYAARQFLKSTYRLSRPVYVVYGGVDTRFFSPKRALIRRLPHLNKRFKRSDVIVAYAGRFIWSKGIVYLYNAIKALLPKLSKDVFFVLAGSGQLEAQLRSEIQRDGLADRIFLTGALSSRGVRDVLRVSDILIHPSHHNEGFPNVILEAAATGCFIIASDNAGVREVVFHKKTGYLIGQRSESDIQKSLGWALDHEQKRQVFTAKMRELVVTRFDWNLIAQKYYRLLRRLTTRGHLL